MDDSGCQSGLCSCCLKGVLATLRVNVKKPGHRECDPYARACRIEEFARQRLQRQEEEAARQAAKKAVQDQ